MIFPPENNFIGFDEGLSNSNLLSRRRLTKSSSHKDHYSSANEVQEVPTNREDSQWKRIILLIVAITVHNIPGKLSNDQLGVCLTCFGSESQCFCICQQKILNNKVYGMVISIIKPTRCTISQIYFILEQHSTCFGRSLRPSSGV